MAGAPKLSTIFIEVPIAISLTLAIAFEEPVFDNFLGSRLKFFPAITPIIESPPNSAKLKLPYAQRN